MPVITGRCLIGDTFEPCKLSIKDGLICDIERITSDATLPIIAPGFIDLQVNGAADKLLNATPDIAALEHIGQALQRLGTTAWLATMVTDDAAKMTALAEAVIGSRHINHGVLGVHFEGPHISAAKKGVHNEAFIRPVAEAELSLYGRQDLGCRLLTLAPETLNDDVLTDLKALGCRLAIGHSVADYQTTQRALELGISCATHLFNAMTGLDSREPGVVGAILDSDVAYGLILDGEHVHPTMARLAYTSNPNMILVTDAMPLLASEQSQFEWFGQEITRVGKRLTDGDGRLAGACISQLDAVQNALSFLNIELAQALQLVTRNPAQLLGIYPHYGAIAIGSRADLVALDDDANLLNVWLAGVPLAVA